jgi:hypothetical protein
MKSSASDAPSMLPNNLSRCQALNQEHQVKIFANNWQNALFAAAAMCGSLSLAEASERVAVGAIRWDAWFTDAVNPYENNLADKQWHGRLPFYAKIISDTKVEVRGDTQAAVDQEIAYAKAGGIDYWAFLYYREGIRNDGFNHGYMNRARRLYLTSQHKSDVNFCLIVNPRRTTDPRNMDNDAPVSSLDLLPTALAVAGAEPLPDISLEGVNLLPYRTGKTKDAPHDVLYWRWQDKCAVRQGDWKWVRVTNNPEELYNLATDPHEKTNCAAGHPEELKKLAGLFTAWNTKNPELNPAHFVKEVGATATGGSANTSPNNRKRKIQ